VRLIIIIIAITLFRFSLLAQQPDTVFVLQEVEVKANRIDFSINKQFEPDSLQLQQMRHSQVNNLLSFYSPAYVKSYGNGNLSTVSIRGTNAQHTAVLWNGLSLNNPMNGIADLSQLPVWLPDEIFIESGGASALHGSGSIGGTVFMNNKSLFNSGVTANSGITAGSFNDNMQQFSVSYGSRFSFSKLLFYRNFSENNFPFKNSSLPGKPAEKQTNARVSQLGGLIQQDFKLNKNNLLNFRYWINENNRQVPPIMTSINNLASVVSGSKRFSADFENRGKKRLSYIRFGFFDESIEHHLPLLKEVFHNRSKSYISEIENRIQLSQKNEFTVGLHNTHSTAISENYSQNSAVENNSAAFAAYLFTIPGLKISASVRQQFYGKKILPVSASGGFIKTLNPSLSLRGNISRNYRLPTLNDLYWNPGGNQELKPETSVSEEISLNFNKKTLSANLTFFNSNINELIQWIPIDNIWSAQNVRKVWNRGMESEIKYTRKSGKYLLTSSLLYSRIYSTYNSLAAVNDGAEGKQLIYVPKDNSRLNVNLSSEKYFTGLNLNFTGIRYTTTDNSDFLDPFLLADLFFGRTFKKENLIFNVSGRINNLLNTQYEVIAWQPMPGRNYTISIFTNFNHKTNFLKPIK
jgi:vitamin B12 transporter